MRIKKLNQKDTLEILSVSYRVQRELDGKYKLPSLHTSILTLLAAYANRPAEEVLSLSCGELHVLLGYSKTSRERIYRALASLASGKEPYLKKIKPAKGAANYQLTPKGIRIAKEALDLTAQHRFYLTEISA